MMIRQLAFHALAMVVRRIRPFAPPKIQEWGDAMLREMDFVKGDWAALSWAFGSARAFIRGALKSPVTEPEDVASRARLFEAKMRLRSYAAWAIAVPWAAYSVVFATSSPDTIQRIACAVQSVALLSLAIGTTARRPRGLLAGAEPDRWVALFRAELMRQVHLRRGFRFWARMAAVLLGFVLFIVADARMRPMLTAKIYSSGAIVLAIIIVASLLGARRKANNYQRQIDELDALPKSN